jgi:hypothetical protein
MADKDPDVARGLQAWQRLKEAGRTSWADWILIGIALMAGRQYAMEIAKTNKLKSKRYIQAFHYWLETRGFLEIDKADRVKLLSIMEDLERIEKWREGLTEAQRAAWNHPSTVWRVSRCKDRGIDAVNAKAEAPIPNPKDLPQPADQFEEDKEALVWQCGLLERVRKAIDGVKLHHDHWLIPEPPDKGLIAVVEELIKEATALRDYLKWANEATPEELAEAREGKKSQPHQEAEPVLANVD